MANLPRSLRPLFVAGLFFTILAGVAGPAAAQEPNISINKGPRLDFPAGLATDNRTVYAASSRNNTVTAIDIASHSIRILAGETFKDGSTDGTGEQARFNSPEGLALIGTDLYVVDTNNSDVRKVDVTSGAVTTVAGQPNISGTEDGPATDSHFNLPTQMATDGTYLYICDSDNHTVRRFSPVDKQVKTIGGQAQQSGKQDGPVKTSLFNDPRGIATDGKNVYVSDTGNDIIRKIDLNAMTVSTIAGTGEEGTDDGAGDKAKFNNPGALCLNGTTLYILDADNHAIRKLDTGSNMVSTLTQVNGHIGSGCAITSDGSILYYSDTTENSIQATQTSNGNFTPLWPVGQ